TGTGSVDAVQLNSEIPVFVRQCEVMDSAHSNSAAMPLSKAAGSATSSRIFTDHVVPIVRPVKVNGSGVASVCGHTRAPMTAIRAAVTNTNAVQSRRPQ